MTHLFTADLVQGQHYWFRHKRDIHGRPTLWEMSAMSQDSQGELLVLCFSQFLRREQLDDASMDFCGPISKPVDGLNA